MASLKKINKTRRGRRDSKILQKRHKKAVKFGLEVERRKQVVDQFLKYSEENKS